MSIAGLLRARHVLVVSVSSRLRKSFLTASSSLRNLQNRNLPAQVDVLDRYQTLVTLGKITYHEDQVRLALQLRKLQRELVDYAPPALSARFFQPTGTFIGRDIASSEEMLWWKFSPGEEAVDRDVKALVTRKTHAEEIASLNTPKGLLLTGPPGSGKSFIVDLWYSTVSTPYKARKHYNQLVLEIYRSVWEETQRRMQAHYASSGSPLSLNGMEDNSQGRGPWNRSIRDHWRNLVGKSGLPSKWIRSGPFLNPGYTDPTIAFTVAKRLVLHHWLLVFDEIQLLDVSSAGLLSDVLSWYWRMGGVIVGTSNKVPDDLYKNGVQRERLEPFVEALKARCPLYELDVKRDWREEMGKLEFGLGCKTWFTQEQRDAFTQYLQVLTKTQPGGEGYRELRVFGRILRVPWAHGTIAKFKFSELCEESLGAADYLTLASTFSQVIVTDIPVLPLSSKNQARRFISLIDALYESRCKLVCLAAAPLESIFFPDSPHSGQALHDALFAESVTESQEYYRPNVSYYDAPEMQTEIAQAVDGEKKDSKKGALQLEELSIFSGKDEQFAFKRALSRIQEMTSETYNQQDDDWTPLPVEERKWEAKSKPPPMRAQGQGPQLDGGSVYGSQNGAMSLQADLDPLRHAANRTPTGSAHPRHQDGRQPTYSSAEAMIKRPHAPHIHPDLHIWGMSEQSEQWGSLAASRRAKGRNDEASAQKKGQGSPPAPAPTDPLPSGQTATGSAPTTKEKVGE
ncbi:AFG1-like ATPase-domain-containing protein [Coprinopsis sp. MPI-PUGE-AT-0042]|nr:AFG1-like ATPase-domain-containing protein [Coprinopsis sp. MPI-PUGE-AT-0042]